MQNKNKLEQLQAQWDNATERALQQPAENQALGDMLQEAAGLHIKSGVQAGGIWGTTSCTCENTCDCTPP